MAQELTEVEESEILAACRVNPGLTPERIRYAIRVWRPIYEADGKTVTVQDAVTIIYNTTGLLRVFFNLNPYGRSR